MGDHVRELIGKVAEEIFNGDDNGQENNWVLAEKKVRKYIELMEWRDPENDIAWHLANCSLPGEYGRVQRDKALWYTTMDVFQRPLVV